MIQPEQLSLLAHRHIEHYLEGRTQLSEDDLTAVLRLSQHLRVFGLLSAIGYTNQRNNQEGRVRERTADVWKSLLWQLLHDAGEPDVQALKTEVINMATQQPAIYMSTWRRALELSKHWNFWARAYR
jgi:hypothetical protein